MENKEIEERIKELIEDFNMFQLPSEDNPNKGLVFAYLTSSPEEIGLLYTALGNKKEASVWFKKAIFYNTENIKRKDHPGIVGSSELISYGRIVYDAILTQDKKFIKDEITDKIYKEEEKIYEKIKYTGKLNKFLFYEFAVIADLISGDETKTREHLATLKKVNEKNPIGGSYPIYDAVEGILKKDLELVKEGINKILKRHVGLLRCRFLRCIENKVICIPATCLLLLARDKCIKIDIAKDVEKEYQKYIPKILIGDK